MSAVLCAAWLLAVALVVLWPTPVDRAGGGWLRGVLRDLHAQGLPAAVTYGSVEFLSNVLMFVPYGVFWFILSPRGWRWVGPLVGLGLSVAIEVTQLVLLPQRVASPYDVLANALGALAGCLVGWFLLRLRQERRAL